MNLCRGTTLGVAPVFGLPWSPGLRGGRFRNRAGSFPLRRPLPILLNQLLLCSLDRHRAVNLPPGLGATEPGERSGSGAESVVFHVKHREAMGWMFSRAPVWASWVLCAVSRQASNRLARGWGGARVASGTIARWRGCHEPLSAHAGAGRGDDHSDDRGGADVRARGGAGVVVGRRRHREDHAVGECGTHHFGGPRARRSPGADPARWRARGGREDRSTTSTSVASIRRWSPGRRTSTPSTRLRATRIVEAVAADRRIPRTAGVSRPCEAPGERRSPPSTRESGLRTIRWGQPRNAARSCSRANFGLAPMIVVLTSPLWKTFIAGIDVI